MLVLIEALQRESTISGGLYNAERCCWGRVLERESRMSRERKCAKRKYCTIEASTMLKDVVGAGFWIEKAGCLSRKKLYTEKVQHLEVSIYIMLKDVVEAGF